MAIFLVFAILIASFLNQVNTKSVSFDTRSVSNVAVIGAGASGLVSTKHLAAKGFNVRVYEQTDHIGGIWRYTEETGKDRYGLDINSPMYQGLRTNSLHQITEFFGHPYPEGTESFPPQPEVLKYIESYADRFNLTTYIKFSHYVVRVSPIENDKWEIIVKNLPNNTVETQIYDAVFVCNGQRTKPRFPNVRDKDEFKGKLMHSKEYRRREKFVGEDVLVIGAGASARDIVAQLSTIARRITISQHKRPNETKKARHEREKRLPPNVVLQDDVKRFTSTGAEFVDGTHQNFTVIICATGYDFSHSFLSVESGIFVEDNFVQPLYKHIFNIRHPTMAFIGIPRWVSTFPSFYMEVQFAVKFITGEKKLPTESEMMADMREQNQIHWNKGFSRRKTHNLYPEREYYKQLTDTAEIENFPDVILSLTDENARLLREEPTEFRKYKYTVIDDKTFKRETCEDGN